jgi:hypothetical protein
LDACAPAVTRITVDPAVRYQTISGWEVDSYLREGSEKDAAAAEHFKTEVYDRAVGEVGINRMRIDIRSGVEGGAAEAWRRLNSGQIDYESWKPRRYATINDNADPYVIRWAGFDFAEFDARIEQGVLPLKARLEARGEKLFVNVCYVAFTEQLPKGAPYDHGDPEEYAEFVLAAYQHMQAKYGFVPDAWEVILEPDKNNIYWANGQALGRAMVAAARRLRENGFTPHFIAPSTLDVRQASRYFDEMATVPGALADLKELSFHRYLGATDVAFRAVRARADAHHLDTAQLEFWFGRGTYGVLHEDLKTARVSAWQGETLRDLFKIDDRDPLHPRVRLGEDTRVNLQYFRYIRAGASRVGANTTVTAFDPLAFVNVNGAYAVTIKARHAGPVAVAGLPAGTYGVSYATTNQSGGTAARQTIAAGGLVQAAIPGPGVVTVYDARLATQRPLSPR